MRVLVKKEVLFHADPAVRETALESLAAAFAVRERLCERERDCV